MPSLTLRGGIASLPSEILEKIIYFVLTEARYIREYTGGGYPVKTGRPYSRALLHITHVSRFWRSCAQGSQRLWTNIWPCGQHPAYIDEALARAGPAGLLEIHIADCQELPSALIKRGVSHFVSLLANETHRIAILHFHGRVHGRLIGHAELESLDAPALRRLCIHGDAEWSLDIWSALRCPNLQTLVVSRTVHGEIWRQIQTKFCLPTLRMLVFGDWIPPVAPMFGKIFPSADDALEVLRGLPQLDALSLSILESKVAAGTAEVTLPHLRHLQFAMDNPTHQSLLKHLVVPSTTCIRQSDTSKVYRLDSKSLEYVTPMPRADELYSWFRTLARPWYLEMDFAIDGTAKLSGAMVAPSGIIPASSPPPFPVTSEDDLRQCAEQHPFENIRTLKLVDAYRRDTGPLSGGLNRFFAQFADVCELELSGDIGPDSGFVPEDLKRLIDQFPRLEVLYLHESFRMRHWAVRKNMFSDVHIALGFKHALATLLARRPSDQGDGCIEIFWMGMGVELESY